MKLPPNPLIYEILEAASKARLKADKIKILKDHDSWALRDVLRATYDKKIENVFDIQNDFVEMITNSLNARVSTREKKILNFGADTSTNDPFTYDNAESFVMNWWLGAGSNYSGGTLNTSWADNTSANRAAGVLNLADSTDNDWYLTGVQLEFGTFDENSLPKFQFESYGDNLKRCQRYCQIYTQPPLIGSANANNTIARASFGLITTMRAAPTATQSGTFSWFYSNSHQPTSTAFSATYTDENTFEADVTVSGTGMTATHPCSIFQSGSAYLLLTADLLAG